MPLVNARGLVVAFSGALLSCMGFVGEALPGRDVGVDSGVLVEDAGHADAGSFVKTFTGDRPNPYDDAGIAPWFTAVGAGEL